MIAAVYEITAEPWRLVAGFGLLALGGLLVIRGTVNLQLRWPGRRRHRPKHRR